MVTNDEILELVKAKGPLLPIDLVKELGGSTKTNTFFVGAMLSELSNANKIKISNLKVGGSPLYFVSGQEFKLQNFSKYMHDKEKQVYEKLKQEKILRDKEQTPVERIALRNIKDFARPLEVKLEDKELFWKWYLVPNDEAQSIIKDMLKKEHGLKQSASESKPIQKEEPKPVRKPEPKPIQKEDPKPVQQTGEELKHQPKEEFIVQKPEPKQEQQSYLASEKSSDPFVKKIQEYFQQQNITVMNTKIAKKNSEVEFILKIPSAIGRLNYYCYAKNKKRCNDSDLSLAYVKANQKNLPALFLCPGELSKKGYEALEKELKTVTFRKL